MKTTIKGRASHATPERVARFVQIVELLKGGKLSMAELSKACGIGKTTIGKYVKDMMQNDVIHAAGVIGMSRHYRLNPREGIVDAFIAALNAPAQQGQPYTRGIKQPKAAGNIHVMNDDAIFKIKVASQKIPAHTPLMEAFYGMKSA